MRSVSSVRHEGVRKVLSKGQKRLLERIINSRGGESITELCSSAKVSPKVYYRMVSDPSIGNLLPEALDYLLSQQLVPVVQMIIKRALEGSAKHSELVLKIVGLVGSDEATKILQIFNNAEPSGALMSEEQVNRLLGLN